MALAQRLGHSGEVLDDAGVAAPRGVVAAQVDEHERAGQADALDRGARR